MDPELAELAERHDAFRKAEEALHVQINKVYPVGARVRTRWGRSGWLYGQVHAECWSRGHVNFLTNTGNAHSAHFTEIEKGILLKLKRCPEP